MKVTREFHIESAGNPHNSVGINWFSFLKAFFLTYPSAYSKNILIVLKLFEHDQNPNLHLLSRPKYILVGTKMFQAR